MAEEVEKVEMALSQKRVEPVAVAAADAAAVVHVDEVGVGVVAVAAAAGVAGVGVGVGADDCDCVARILPARTRGQRYHVQIHSLPALCAH